MPIEPYHDQLEPEDNEAVIWRFMNFEKFRDLMVSSELYFCRADLFNENDEREGLPPQEFLTRWGLHPLDVRDRRQLVDHIGVAAQCREDFYVSCWHLFREETCKMWEKYGKDGVAICSRYSLLKSALDSMPDRAFIGLVRYESGFMVHANLLSYITNKRAEYAHEKEVRAFLWIIAQNRGGNRHIDSEGRAHPHVMEPPPDSVSEGEKRVLDLNQLVTRIVVTPWASPTLVSEVDELSRASDRKIPVVPSELTRYRNFLPEPSAGESSWR